MIIEKDVSSQTSFNEKVFAFYLRKTGLKIKENVLLKDTLNEVIERDKKSFDIYFQKQNMKFAIEYDGSYYHNNTVDNDNIKNLISKANDVRIIHIREKGLNKLDRRRGCYNHIMKDNSEKEIIKSLNYIKSVLELYGIKIKDFDVNIERDRDEILGLLKLSPVDNSISKVRPQWLYEWDYDKNTVNPNCISINSHFILNWKCPRGHNWKARPMNRNNGNGCPYCANRKLLKGFNDLKTLYPKIAEMWYEENINKPEEILGKSEQKVIWKCNKCNHIFERKVYKQIQMNGKCPNCKKEV